VRTPTSTRTAILATAALWCAVSAGAVAQQPTTATPAAAEAPATAPPTAGSLRAQAEANVLEDKKLETTAAPPPCATSAADAIARLHTAGEKEAYDCVMNSEGADLLLLAALAPLPPYDPDATDTPRNRLTRALAMYGIARMDLALSADLVRAVNPADRRLMRDAVHARKGRKSPSAAHEAVFTQFTWYSPDPKYTDGRLSAIDKANVALIDKPPPPPEPEVESAAEAMAAAEPAAPSKSWCGCSASAGAQRGGGLLLLGLTIAGLLRRRR
jgi:MYXO-CTERM domain-containing protein